MGSNENRVLDYRRSVPSTFRRRYSQFCLGVICGEVVSVLLICIVTLTGAIFPMTLVYPHLLVFPEARPDLVRALPGWSRLTMSVLSLFVLGPLLFGAYALLPGMRRRWLWIAIAGFVHFALFVWVCYLRDALH